LQQSDIPSVGAIGVAPPIVANRVSFVHGLTGPSMAIDTACSSSVAALSSVEMSIHSAIARASLVAGVNLQLQPMVTDSFNQAHMLSAIGRCATFEESADGYVRGDGCGAVVIAQQTADHLAEFFGCAVNQDGRSATITAPHGPSQQAVICSAIASAGISEEIMTYVECHGTGTPLGDPIEFGALRAVLAQPHADKPMFLGALKSNFGHLEGAAGIDGFRKSILMLFEGDVPANLHLRVMNPHMDRQGFPFLLTTDACPNYSSRGRAGVSSFGFGGTNAHAILGSARGGTPKERAMHKLKPEVKYTGTPFNMRCQLD
jgi:acyl transferase domain-containing protein